MIKLPLIYKIPLLSFKKEFEQLSKKRKIKVTIPERRISTNIIWESDLSITYDEVYVREPIENSEEIKNINEKIKNFNKNVESFGKEHFKNKLWVWENLLWLLPNKIKWVD